MNDIDQTKQLLRDLVTGFIEEPDKLEIGAQEADDGAAYFAMKGSEGDHGALVGFGGSHVDAMALLVARIGAARRRPWSFRLIKNGESRRAPQPPWDVVAHDPSTALDVLTRALAHLKIAAEVRVGNGDGARNALMFVFTIRPASAADRAQIERESTPGDQQTSILAALGSLFRARGKRAGVKYQFIISSNGI